MIVEQWAEEFARTPDLTARGTDQIALHLADTAAAFFAGCRSAEARALAKALGGKRNTGEIDRLAAAASAIIRRTECDDIHMASCITPGSVVMPVALATAGDGPRFGPAVAAGYAVGMRLGAALGGPAGLAGGIWPTFFAAPMMAAATAAIGLGLGREKIAHAIALAAAGAGGRIGRAGGALSGRWLGLGEAVAKGCRAAMAAAAGFQGDVSLIAPDWLATIGAGNLLRPEMLSAYPAARAPEAVGLKPFVAARQVINAVVAFRSILKEGIAPQSMTRIEIGVPAGNLAMAGRPATPGDRLGRIASMGLQIASAALQSSLLYDIERAQEPSAELLAFAERVTVVGDPALEAAFPEVWGGSARVEAGGRRVAAACLSVPGDPGTGQIEALEDKLARMVPAEFRPLCRAVLDGGDAGAARRDLWAAMQAAIGA